MDQVSKQIGLGFESMPLFSTWLELKRPLVEVSSFIHQGQDSVLQELSEEQRQANASLINEMKSFMATADRAKYKEEIAVSEGG